MGTVETDDKVSSHPSAASTRIRSERCRGAAKAAMRPADACRGYVMSCVELRAASLTRQHLDRRRANVRGLQHPRPPALSIPAR